MTLTLNAAADNLPPGTYAAAIQFTNEEDGFIQSRQLLLTVAVTSAAPVIVTQPISQTALPGASVTFTVADRRQRPALLAMAEELHQFG